MVELNPPQWGPMTLLCQQGSGATTGHYYLKNTGSLVSCSGIGKYSGKVYETGVSGIGVAWSIDSHSIIVDKSNVQGDFKSGGRLMLGTGLNARNQCTTAPLYMQKPTLVFIKTGAVASGGGIKGNDLGRIGYSVKVGDGSLFEVAEVSVAGSVEITNQTCKASDIQVPMGSYNVSAFTAKNVTTASKSFVVRLTGCPGYSSSYTIHYQLDSVGGAFDGKRGILKLAAVKGAAAGVGIQILTESGSTLSLGEKKAKCKISK